MVTNLNIQYLIFHFLWYWINLGLLNCSSKQILLLDFSSSIFLLLFSAQKYQQQYLRIEPIDCYKIHIAKNLHEIHLNLSQQSYSYFIHKTNLILALSNRFLLYCYSEKYTLCRCYLRFQKLKVLSLFSLLIRALKFILINNLCLRID